MNRQIPADVKMMLRTASEVAAEPTRKFVCKVFDDPTWNAFVEQWAPIIYTFVEQALGPYGTEPRTEILALETGMHAAGATASFDMISGQVSLCKSVQGKPGQTLEKLTHEFTHGSLSQFPEGDPFYEESQVDFATWIMAHAPVWGAHREDMIAAAEFNIEHRRERAFTTGTDYDRKRWAGGVHVMFAYGPYLIGRLRNKKLAGEFSW